MTPVTIEPAPRVAQGRGRSVRWPLTLLAAGLFFFGPALAFAAGDRAVDFENRRLPDFPALTRGWAAVPEAEAWAVAHLPLRRHAVRGNAALSERLFGQMPAYNTGAEPTYPRAIEGRDGWLYFGDDVIEACRPGWSVAETLDRVRRLAGIVQRSGRLFVFTIAPDKTTAYPDRLPERFLGQTCLNRRKQEFWTALRATSMPGYMDLRGPIERSQRESGVPVYWRTDSHWTERTNGLYAAELARTLDPELSRDTRLVEIASTRRIGDLGPMLGTPRTETIEQWRVLREGVTQTRRDDKELPVSFTIANTSAKAPLYRPATLLVGDSFTRNSLAWLTPYFADMTYLRSDAPTKSPPDYIAAKFARSETVVFEMVERHLVGGHGEMLEDATLAALERALH